jgi:hypothetical protein
MLGTHLQVLGQVNKCRYSGPRFKAVRLSRCLQAAIQSKNSYQNNDEE